MSSVKPRHIHVIQLAGFVVFYSILTRLALKLNIYVLSIVCNVEIVEWRTMCEIDGGERKKEEILAYTLCLTSSFPAAALMLSEQQLSC